MKCKEFLYRVVNETNVKLGRLLVGLYCFAAGLVLKNSESQPYYYIG